MRSAGWPRTLIQRVKLRLSEYPSPKSQRGPGQFQPIGWMDVSAADDGPDFFACEYFRMIPDGCDDRRGRRLYQHFQFLPEQDHCGANIIITDGQHAADFIPDYLEIANTHNCPETVSYRVRREILYDLPLLQTGDSIGCTLGLHGEHFDTPGPCCNSRSADQTSTTQWCDDLLQGWHLLFQFQCGGSLSCDNALIVVRVNRYHSSLNQLFKF